jgi:hypothetical protein
MSEYTVNVNDVVKVRLYPRGHEILEKNSARIWAGHPNPPAYTRPKEDENGWSQFQLWVLMKEFGEEMHLGLSPPFETEIKVSVKEPA